MCVLQCSLLSLVFWWRAEATDPAGASKLKPPAEAAVATEAAKPSAEASCRSLHGFSIAPAQIQDEKSGLYETE